MRQKNNWTPVILLTQVSGTAQRIMAIEEGADDYLNKPFDPQELVVRIRAVLRRTQAGKQPLQTSRRLKSKHFVLDRSARRLYIDNREIPLTPKAVANLEYFMTHADELISCERLLDVVWGWESVVGERTVDTRIAELRKALGDDSTDPQFIAVVAVLGVLVFRQIWIQHQIVAASDDLQENLYQLEEVTDELQDELDTIQTTDRSEEVEETMDGITNLLDGVDDQLDTVGEGLHDVALVLEPEPETVADPTYAANEAQQDSMDEMFTIFAVLIGLTSIVIAVLLGIAIHIQQIASDE